MVSQDRYDTREPKHKDLSRPTKDEYYIMVADVISKRSTCLKAKFGCVIVKNDRIVGTGYNGSARGVINCCDEGICNRERGGGKRIPGDYSKCISVHSEPNAIMCAGSDSCMGAKVYIGRSHIELPNGKPIVREHGTKREFPSNMPCKACMREIINAGISELIIRDDDNMIKRFNISSFVRKGVFGT